MNSSSAPSGTPRGLKDLPNIITVLRMASVVPLAWLLLEGRYVAALWLAFVAGASDAVDGFLAKRFGWVSHLGGVLDPLADKLLLFAGYVVLAIQGYVPVWLVVLVVARDVVIVAGATAFHYLVRPVNAEPTLLSKLNTCVQIAQVLVVLVSLAYGWTSQILLESLIWIVAVTTAASGLQYVIVWGRRAWTMTREESP